MKDLSRVKFKKGRPYITYLIKTGRKKGILMKVFGVMISCRECKENAFVSNTQIKRVKESVCSHKCQKLRDKCERWKGGIRKGMGRYIRIMVGKDYEGSDDHGYVYEHRYVVEQSIGRKLKKGEVVHHIDMNPSNNRIDNLRVMDTASHLTLHRMLAKAKK